jgi:hypothetical protein
MTRCLEIAETAKTVTRMSFWLGKQGPFEPRGGVARLSLLCALMALGVTGCLDATPQYVAPSPVPPVIDYAGVVPTTTAVTTIRATVSLVQFTIPFRSDDEGQQLRALFIRDFDPTKDPAQAAVVQDILSDADSRPFAQQLTNGLPDRSITFPWQLPSDTRPVGCHTLTMLLSHKNNFQTYYLTSDDLDVAQVTWFFDFLQAGGTASSDCFVTGTSQ